MWPGRYFDLSNSSTFTRSYIGVVSFVSYAFSLLYDRNRILNKRIRYKCKQIKYVFIAVLVYSKKYGYYKSWLLNKAIGRNMPIRMIIWLLVYDSLFERLSNNYTVMDRMKNSSA